MIIVIIFAATVAEITRDGRRVRYSLDVRIQTTLTLARVA